MEVFIDEEKCIGCGSCVQICPDSFEIRNGKAHLKKRDIGKVSCEGKARDNCPVGAISILE